MAEGLGILSLVFSHLCTILIRIVPLNLYSSHMVFFPCRECGVVWLHGGHICADDRSCEFFCAALPVPSPSSTTSMHFATRSLTRLARCKPTHCVSNRGFHAFQSAPGPKSRPGIAGLLRFSRQNVPPFVCRRMLHASFGEPLLVPSVDPRLSHLNQWPDTDK